MKDGGDSGGGENKKSHRGRQGGVKAKKKKDKKKEKKNGKVERHNPRAFTFSGGSKSVAKKVQFTLDKQTKKDHAPIIDKNPAQPPPYVIVVHGPPGSGKSTLIRSLVKHYTKHNLPEISGPITLVSSKNRRLTFFEAPQDVGAQLDLAKVADLVLLMIDASFGFEMETFEFINIMQQHGFPKVIGVLTHLDKFKEPSMVRKVKKNMKKRFWQEIYEGAKLFYMSGLQYGRYNKTETLNLSRFIGVTKKPILSWRQTHPYVIGQRIEEEQTEDPRAPRTVHIYGYVYGGRMREGQTVHFCGVGDFPIAAISEYTDPCAAPVRADGKDHKKNNATALRSLQQKHRALYAPGCDVGNVKMDKDALYINLPEHKVGFTVKEGEEEGELQVPEAVKMVRELQGGKNQLEAPTELIIEKGNIVRRRADDVWADDEEKEEKLAFADEVSDSDDEEGKEYKAAFLQEASRRYASERSLEDLIYATTLRMEQTRTPSTSSSWNLFDGDEDETTALSEQSAVNHEVDSNRLTSFGSLWSEGDLRESLKMRKFITGGVSDDEDDGDESGGEGTREKKTGKDAFGGDEDEDKDIEGGDGAKKENPVKVDTSEFTDALGIAAYAKITLENVPALSVLSLDFPRRPIVLGGLLPGEMKMGFTQLRIKKHRWNPKILKSNDVLLASVGWRRYQTLPVYSIEDRNNKRMRMLKYTPDHMHCIMTIYGPTIPANSGALFIRNFNHIKHYRISATGHALESAPNFQIMKKLKLVGEPLKIFKNTAFIKNMFTSDLEVNKLLHVKIQTVSGIRGEVKKAEGTDGTFRASFEDKILMGDLIVCKSWISVEPKKFYNPMLDVSEWKHLRTLAEIRRDKGVPIPFNKNSEYGQKIERKERRFNKLKIPSALEAALPFNSKRKLVEKRIKTSLEKKTKIVSSEAEKEKRFLVQRLETIRRDRATKKKDKSVKKLQLKEKREAFIQTKRNEHTKERKKKEYVKQGKMETQKRKRLRMEE
eukprot:GEMP01009948.1.p1 GENE.GEMP01009948.1~~GEMP01009948.1.p1  ORF type:complete len:996 (-),score=245.75 GEMP01009948.1:342-3329(-)